MVGISVGLAFGVVGSVLILESDLGYVDAEQSVYTLGLDGQGNKPTS